MSFRRLVEEDFTGTLDSTSAHRLDRSHTYSLVVYPERFQNHDKTRTTKCVETPFPTPYDVVIVQSSGKLGPSTPGVSHNPTDFYLKLHFKERTDYNTRLLDCSLYMTKGGREVRKEGKRKGVRERKRKRGRGEKKEEP